MVEQPDVLLNKGHAQLLGRLHYCAVVLTSSGRSNVLDTTPVRPEDVVDEWEERIRADSDALHLREPLLALIRGEWLGYLFEVGLEVIALDARLRDEARAQEVDGVGF